MLLTEGAVLRSLANGRAIAVAGDSRDDINATDWQIALAGGVSAGAGIGGGIMFAYLKSAHAGVEELFCFAIGGLGAGGNLTSVDPNAVKGAQYAPMTKIVNGGFSVNALNGAPGFVVFASAGAPTPKGISKYASYGFVNLNATFRGTEMFFFKTGVSFGVGSGTGLGGMAGVWYSYRKKGLLPVGILLDNTRGVVEDAKKTVRESSTWKSFEQWYGDLENAIKRHVGMP